MAWLTPSLPRSSLGGDDNVEGALSIEMASMPAVFKGSLSGTSSRRSTIETLSTRERSLKFLDEHFGPRNAQGSSRPSPLSFLMEDLLDVEEDVGNGPDIREGPSAVPRGGSVKRQLVNFFRLRYDTRFESTGPFGFPVKIQLAIRAAAVFTLLSIPLMVGVRDEMEKHLAEPSSASPLRREAANFLRNAFLRNNTVYYIVYALGANIGSMAPNIWSSVFSAVLCLTNVLTMYWICPHEDSPRYFVAHVVNGFLFQLALLGLNFEPLTVIFGTAFFPCYWMNFLQMSGKDRAAVSDAFQEALSSLIGCALLFLTLLLPYPLFAMHATQDAAEDSVRTVSNAWDSVVATSCGSHERPVENDRQLKDVEGFLDELETLIEESAFETFFSHRWKTGANLLRYLHRSLRESSEWLGFAQSTCQSATHPVLHAQLMSHVKYELLEVLRFANLLLRRGMHLVFEGEMKQSAHTALCRAQQRLELATISLSGRFAEAKTQFDCEGISYECLAEHAFCSSVCFYARICLEFTDNVIKYYLGKRLKDRRTWWRRTGWAKRILAKMSKDTKDIFDWEVISERSHVLNTIRNGLAMVIAMSIGYHGVPWLGIPEYDSSVAMTVGLLCNQSRGSAWTKNLARLQGAFLGMLIAVVATMISAHCQYPLNAAVQGSFIFASALYGMVIYLNSPNYADSYYGFSVTIFSFRGMITDPTDDTSAHVQAWAYISMPIIVSLGVVTVLDAVFSEGSAFDLAKDQIFQAWERLGLAALEMLDPATETFVFPGSEIRGHLIAAERSRLQALHSPAFWRSRWQRDLLGESVASTSKFRFYLACMAISLQTKHKISTLQSSKGGVVSKPMFFKHLLSSRTFALIRRHLLEEIRMQKDLMRDMATLSRTHMKQELEVALFGPKPVKRWKERLQLWEAMVEELVKEDLGQLNTEQFAGSSHPLDPCAQISYVVFAVRALMEVLVEFRCTATKIYAGKLARRREKRVASDL